MPTYIARSQWSGTLDEGSGRMRVGSGAIDAPVSSRPQAGEVTNPEETVGAALAGGYSMVLTRLLEEAGYSPAAVRATAAVEVKPGGEHVHIPRISLDVRVRVNDMAIDELRRITREAERACPVARALGGTRIDLHASLDGGARGSHTP